MRSEVAKSGGMVSILPAVGEAAIESVRILMREYARSLSVDLAFQAFEAELASLPGRYAAPGGALLLAVVDGKLAGCGGLRPLAEVDEPGACEMKRLYVRPACRGAGAGRALVAALLAEGRRLGHAVMLLDSLSEMDPARRLYAAFGFTATAPYYANPLPGAVYLRRTLHDLPAA